VWITPTDLAPFADISLEKAQAMIDDAEATAISLVPALTTVQLTIDQAAGVRAILRRAILRWHEQGSGAFTQEQETAGPFSHQWTADTRQKASKGIFWPSEVASLEQIVGAGGRHAFSIDQAQPAGGAVPAMPADLLSRYYFGQISG